jgi:conjugal transfer ATP-binding protein TraC
VLERQAAEVIRVIASLHGGQTMVDEYAQYDEWLAALPANALHGRRWRQATSENAAHLVPAWQSWPGSASPTLLLQNGRGGLVGLDPFNPELDNPNAFMAGSSGSGKSSTTNYILLNLLAAGAGALVIDVGGSYRRVIEIFGGQYFAVGEGQHALNPFFKPQDIVLPDGRLEEQRAQLVAAVIERMVCDRQRPELRNAERAVVGAVLAATYQAVHGRSPILSDFVDQLHQFSGDDEDIATARSLARELRVWTDGPAARLVNRQSTVELTTSCAAFDLKGLESQPALQAVVMLVISGCIWNLVMRDRSRKKIVVFDEVWKLLESPASAALIAELYRTSRKYRASILTISQSVEDFTGSTIAGALVNNSASTYLLKQRRGHDVVAEQFRLNPRERHIMQGLEMRRGEYTEALILHGDHHFLARVVLSPLEYWIATTHPADLALEAELAATHSKLSRLELLGLLAQRYPKGAPSQEQRRGAA